MFELIIGKQGKDGTRAPIQNAAVPIRWCISEDVIEGLQAKCSMIGVK